MWIFYFLFWTAVRASAEEPLYRKIGDKVVLTPDSVENPIYNIRWKHGPNIAMQWNGDETISYKQFKDRGSLNISTGVMTITGLTPDLSGIYTAEINNKVNSEIELLVISPVPKPSIYKSCDTEMTSCVFSCSGSITDTEPVTYWWTAGEKRWNSTKELRITKEEEEQWFICILENPVSSISSEKVFNPFMESDQTWVYILTAVSGVSLVVCIIIYFRCKNKKEMRVMLPDVQYSHSPSIMIHSNSNTAGFKRQWQFEREIEGWGDFRKMRGPLNKCSVTNDDIERWYQEKPHVKMPFTVKGRPYELDFDKMIQTNLKTGNERNIRFVLVPTPRFLQAVSAVLQRKGRSTVISTVSEVNETSAQVLETTEATDTSNDTERPASPPTMEETSTQNTTCAAPPETSNETDLQSSHKDQSPWEYGGMRGGSCHLKRKRSPSKECSVTSDDIERQHQQNPHVSMPHNMNREPNTLDFNGFKPQWQFKRESEGWGDFRETTDPSNKCLVTNDDIEKRYQENHHGKMTFTIKGRSYELDFRERNQTNVKTKTKRKIRRVMVDPEC